MLPLDVNPALLKWAKAKVLVVGAVVVRVEAEVMPDEAEAETQFVTQLPGVG